MMTVREKLFNIVHENMLFYNLEQLETTDRAYFVTKYDTRFQIEYELKEYCEFGNTIFYRAELYLDNKDYWKSFSVIRCPHTIVVDALHAFCVKYQLDDFVYSFLSIIMIDYKKLTEILDKLDLSFCDFVDSALNDFTKDIWGEH